MECPESIDDSLKQKIAVLPELPGVYQFFDVSGKIIYVGKAKNLRKRVHSYFAREHTESAKTRLLVKNIRNLEYIGVDTEYEALLLENTLIKKHQPRFNINLKDDKTFPWICITSEPFPRLFTTRHPRKDGSKYFGPYASVPMMYALLDLIRDIFQVRTCTLPLQADTIAEGKFKICLEYHIKKCQGPCCGYQSAEEYALQIKEITDIIRGDTGKVIRKLEQEMKEKADHFDFEKAHLIKLKINSLANYQSRSTVVNVTVTNTDVFSITDGNEVVYVNFLRVRNGAVIQSHNMELHRKMEEEQSELLQTAMAHVRNLYGDFSEELLIPFPMDIDMPGSKLHVPQKGDKKKLLELSLKNAFLFRKEKEKQLEATDPDRHTNRIMQQMKKDLRLLEEPRLIECFDNSNFQGTDAVSAMTVFRNGKPSKRDYRHFIVKTVSGPDDFATMEEVIYRRYKRVLEEQLELPQLIVVDGGKGQLGAALNSLEKLGLRGKTGIIGIAKRLEEIYYPGDPYPLYLDKKGDTLRILQHIRDEAHRFGITHHRKRREKNTIQTELTQIKGISHSSAERLLAHFSSVKRIREASEAEIEKVVGKHKAGLVFGHFNKNK
ncbi:MAG: excinuclease ABC subunit UvrC [Bacteroidota bacterium]